MINLKGNNYIFRSNIWIIGLIEKSSNRILVLLYPVDKRDEKTLCDIIMSHVEPGIRIFSDGWTGYLNLNEM